MEIGVNNTKNKIKSGILERKKLIIIKTHNNENHIFIKP